MEQPTLSLIGAGQLGKSLGHLWARGGIFRIRDVLCRSQHRAANAVAFIGAGQAAAEVTDLNPADCYLLAVPDDQIASMCTRLAAAGLFSEDSVVFHCSGTLPSNVLRPAQQAGAALASVHPIKSFADPQQAVQTFPGTWCGVEGDARAREVLEPAFSALGAHLVQINPAHKLLYHAGSVFGANYLVTLLDTAVRSYGQAGIAPETALAMLEPLVRKTVDNVFRIGPEQALSGPIERGDNATVNLQYKAVAAWDSDLGAMYKDLARATARLAARKRAAAPDEPA